jgi:Pyruvate/2-oxoacid:ferredoxin oxidoreductase delta subunit
MKIKALHEEKGRLIEELNTLQTSINAEQRSMTDTEKTRFNEIDARLDSIGSEVEVLEKLQKRAAEKIASAPVYGAASTSDKNERNEMANKYSFKRAVEMAATGRREGIEFEMHQEAAAEFQRAGVSVAAHSVLLPSDVFKRDMTATGGSPAGVEGGYNIQTNVGGIIDVLLPATVLNGLGVTRFDNLTGNLDLPQASTQPAAGWNTENGTATEKSPAFGKVSFSPKRLAAFIQVSNQLLRQSSNSIDAYVRQAEHKRRPKVDVHHFSLLEKMQEANLAPDAFDAKAGDQRGTGEGNWAIHNYEDRSGAEVIAHEELFLGHFKFHARNLRKEEVPSAEEVLGHFKERVIGLTEAEAKDEAKRCMSCGMCFECDNCVIFCPQTAVYRVDKKERTTGRYVATDYAKCIGCHICADVCPTGYIKMGLGE